MIAVRENTKNESMMELYRQIPFILKICRIKLSMLARTMELITISVS